MKGKSYNLLNFIIDIFKYAPFQAAATAIYTIILSLMPAFQTLAMAAFIDTVTLIFKGEKEYGTVFLALLCIAASLIYQNVMPSVNNLISVSAENRLRVRLKSQVVQKQASLQYAYMENKESCDLIGRVCDKIDEKFWNEYKNLLEGVRLVIHIFSLLLIVMRYTFLGGLLIVAVSVPLFYLAARMGGDNYQMEKDAEAVKRRYNYLSEVLMNREYAQERILFGYSCFIKEKYRGLFDQSSRVETKILEKRYINMKSGSMVTILLGVVIMAILLPSLGSGSMSSGIYIALVNAVFGLVQSMSWQMSEMVLGVARLKEYLKEYNEFLHMDEKKGALSEPLTDENFIFESLEFQNVTFRYPGTENEILKNCSFQMSGDKTYAFVGANGAGKTTITKLLTGLYENYEGKILINGKDIKEYCYAKLKGIIAVAFQDFAKYALSVDRNVQLGNMNEYSEERIQEAIARVGLSDVVGKLKDGIHTELGRLEEESVDFSGGQWQRMAIARLLYSGCVINILDEPTAALDPSAEAKIYELFQRVKKDRFVMYITHRLGAARIADEILVLKNGCIAERGSHEELVALENGIYREMYESQRSWYE